jgi:hypothetical protein
MTARTPTLYSIVAFAFCLSIASVAAKPPMPAGQLVPIPLAKLSFTHDALRQRIHRIDKIMAGADYPAAKTIAWSRRPNSGRDGKSVDDFVAQWSTATDRLGVSIQPGQEPASTVRIYAEIDPKSAKLKRGPQIWRFSLRGQWKPKVPGWSAMVVIFSSRVHTAKAAGKEKSRIHFRHSDNKSTLSLPLADWAAATPKRPHSPPLPIPRGFKQTMLIFQDTELSVVQTRALTKSAESFRDEAVRRIAAAEARMIADTLASRGVQRGTYRQTDNDGNTQFKASSPKDVKALSADEIKQLRGMAKKEFQRRRAVVQQNYKELHAVILKAFPLDRYVADEPIPDAP